MAERDIPAIVTPASTKAPEDVESSGADVQAEFERSEFASGKTSSFVIIGRICLLLASVAAFATAIVLTRQYDRAATTRSAARYVCPMHPEVVSVTPGDCPICNMALERVSDSPKEPSNAASARDNDIDEVRRRIVAQFVRAPAWLTADGVVSAILHKDELLELASDEIAEFFGTAAPAAGISVRRISEPARQWDSSTVAVRFKLQQSAFAAEDTGWLELGIRPRELLVVPEKAVLYSSKGPYVLAASPGSPAFTRRPIQIGKILDSGHVADLSADHFGAIVVLAGLQVGERVISGDTFFIDAERRLQVARGKADEVVP